MTATRFIVSGKIVGQSKDESLEKAARRARILARKYKATCHVEQFRVVLSIKPDTTSE